MKYVTLRRGEYRYPVVFPDMIEHSQFEGADVVSAGFFAVGHDESVTVYGNSKSLKGLGPKPGDDDLLRTFLDGAESMLVLVQL